MLLSDGYCYTFEMEQAGIAINYASEWDWSGSPVPADNNISDISRISVAVSACLLVHVNVRFGLKGLVEF